MLLLLQAASSPSGVTAALTRTWNCFRYLRQDTLQMRERVEFMRQMYGLDELFLEIRVDGGFDVFYPIGEFFGMASLGPI
jgi:hypothetical protein